MRIFFIEQITSPSPVMVYNGTAKLIFVNGCGVKVIAILSIIVFGIKWKKNYMKIGLQVIQKQEIIVKADRKLVEIYYCQSTRDSS